MRNMTQRQKFVRFLLLSFTEVAVLKKVFRESDIIGRMGGDEFAIIAPNLNESGFRKICTNLEYESESYNKSNKAPFILSISLGMVSFD